jgi:hypothetical protein
VADDCSNVAVLVDGLSAFIGFALLKAHGYVTNCALRKPTLVEHMLPSLGVKTTLAALHIWV